MNKILLIFILSVAIGRANDCIPRLFGKYQIVCVCNATYCDSTPDVSPKTANEGHFYQYTSSKGGLRLSFTKGTFDSKSNGSNVLILDTSKKYQRIKGWGGAFTDAVGINVKNLSVPTQEKLLETYFSKVGSRYTFGRIPIAGCDFSTRLYTYDDFSDDVNLTHFALAEEDILYKIPLIKKALSLSPTLKFIAAPWTAPPWMKTNNKYNGFGFLKKKHYQTYVNYLLKFIEKYKENGIDIWAISTGNEPFNIFVPFFPINKMGWTPCTLAKWVGNNLGPSLTASHFNDTLIVAFDDQRFGLPWYMDRVFKDEKAKKYIAGVGVHWYYDNVIDPKALTSMHTKYSDKFLLMTEACTGAGVWNFKHVDLGSWSRGEKYALDIIENLKHWVVGWIDWNLALNKQGGPNWLKNFVDSPIIVNPETDEFYKQPMYYAIKHFSRFIEEESVRVDITDTRNIKSIAFLTPSGETVIVLCNRKSIPQNISVKDLTKGIINLTLPANSIHSIIYKST